MRLCDRGHENVVPPTGWIGYGDLLAARAAARTVFSDVTAGARPGSHREGDDRESDHEAHHRPEPEDMF